MLKYITETEMSLQGRDSLNFILCVCDIMLTIIIIGLLLSSFKPFAIPVIALTGYLLYCTYINNSIGLQQMRKRREKKD